MIQKYPIFSGQKVQTIPLKVSNISHENLRGLCLERPLGGGTKRTLDLDSMVAPLIWSETNMRAQGIHLSLVNPQGIARYEM
jgi:hypothetical protein